MPFTCTHSQHLTPESPGLGGLQKALCLCRKNLIYHILSLEAKNNIVVYYWRIRIVEVWRVIVCLSLRARVESVVTHGHAQSHRNVWMLYTVHCILFLDLFIILPQGVPVRRNINCLSHMYICSVFMNMIFIRLFCVLCQLIVLY